MKKFAGMSYVRQKNGRFFDFKNLLHVWICYFKLCELLGILLLSNTGTQIIYKCHKANAIKSGQAALTYIGAKNDPTTCSVHKVDLQRVPIKDWWGGGRVDWANKGTPRTPISDQVTDSELIKAYKKAIHKHWKRSWKNIKLQFIHIFWKWSEIGTPPMICSRRYF